MEAFLVVIGMVIIAFLIPCKYDPAIQLKEFNERWAKCIEERNRDR